MPTRITGSDYQLIWIEGGSLQIGVWLTPRTRAQTLDHAPPPKWNNRTSDSDYHNIIRGEPERAPNTRETGIGFIILCIYIIYIYILVYL